MRARIELAISRHCDGIDPDNLFGWEGNVAGLHLTPENQLDYNRYLANGNTYRIIHGKIRIACCITTRNQYQSRGPKVPRADIDRVVIQHAIRILPCIILFIIYFNRIRLMEYPFFVLNRLKL